MKRGTPDHPKTRALIRRLGVHEVQVLGHLELLWQHFAPAYAPRGDIGRHTDQGIEDGLRWTGEPGVLVRALVAERFLDPHPTHRLLIHNWPKHAEDSVHRQLARACQRFADGTAPKLNHLTRLERERAEAAYGAMAEIDGETAGLPVDGQAAVSRQSGGSHVTACRALPGLARPSNGPPLSPPSAGADGGARQLERQRDEVVAYWVALKGRPDRRQRRQVLEELRRGRTVAELKGSVAEIVREQLVQAGRLDPMAEWPPPAAAAAQPP